MLGMDMMLKNMGFDPEEIRKTITGLGQLLADMHDRLQRVENKLDAVLNERKEVENENEKIGYHGDNSVTALHSHKAETDNGGVAQGNSHDNGNGGSPDNVA